MLGHTSASCCALEFFQAGARFQNLCGRQPLSPASFICRWVREFLNDDNKGLDVLVDYLSFAQCSVM